MTRSLQPKWYTAAQAKIIILDGLAEKTKLDTAPKKLQRMTARKMERVKSQFPGRANNNFKTAYFMQKCFLKTLQLTITTKFFCH